MKNTLPMKAKNNDSLLENDPMKVAPHPALQMKMHEEMTRIKALANKSVLADKISFKTKSLPGLNDGLIYPGEMFSLGTSLERIRSAALDKAPLRGDVRVIVVLVSFSNEQFTKPASHFEDLFFSKNTIPTGSVNEYYNEVSYGHVNITGEVVGPFQLPHTQAYYANGNSGTGSASPNARTMAKDTVLAVDGTVNFSRYDNDGNGLVDAFVIVHAGTGAETNNNPDDIWSHKWILEGKKAYQTNDGTNIYSYLTVPEDCRMGVCAHELGHLLFGFPDLYDGDGSSSGIGKWCLMAAGSWNGAIPGDTPAHPSAWCKAMQDWVTVETPMTNRTGVPIENIHDARKILKLWKNGIANKEYFLVENRQQQNFDKYLPGSGLLIWHIDDAMPDNTNEAHYRVALLQADGQRELETGSNSGNSGDAYPGSSNNLALDKNSDPNSRSYAGSDTAVALRIQNVSGITYHVDINVV